MRRFVRSRMKSDPAGSALVLQALSVPPSLGNASTGDGNYGALLMDGSAVRSFFGVEYGWATSPAPAVIRAFFEDMRDYMAPRCGQDSFQALSLAGDTSLYRVSYPVIKTMRSRFVADNAELMAAARDQASRIALPAPVVQAVDEADAGDETPDTVVVCPVLKVPDRIEGLADALQPSILEWSSLASPLPLRGPSPTADGMSDAVRRLRTEAPWMSPVIDRIEERLWLLRSLDRRWVSLPPMLLYGPSGIGKSYFAKRLADALGLGFAETSLAGSTDNREMQGTARGWTNARPSWPVVSIASLGTANPLLFVDEVDKVDSSYHGDPLRAMLTMLDPDTAGRYPDAGLSSICDLSKVSWLLASNQLHTIDTALRDRIEIVTVEGPGHEHLGRIVENVICDLARSLGVARDRLPPADDLGMRRVEDVYASGGSLRGVAKHVHGEMARLARLSVLQPNTAA